MFKSKFRKHFLIINLQNSSFIGEKKLLIIKTFLKLSEKIKNLGKFIFDL